MASEVRSLAQRSAEAAKEIKSLIGTRVNDLIGEISSASMEQSTGIGQIGDAVNQLDQVTQQNAALVEESAAAAESLKVQAAQLAQVVSVFKLAAGDQRDHAPAPTLHPPKATSALRRPAAPAKSRAPAVRSGTKPEAAVATAQAPAPRGAEPVAAGADWESF